jgi:uncharacterized oligopeptide transporter (OPT) family protein
MNHTPWPIWKKILAYLVAGAVAVGSIYFIDRAAMSRVETPPAAPDEQ